MRVLTAGGASNVSSYARSQLSSAANLSTTSTTPVEMDPSLRVSVGVPGSGAVLIRQYAIVYMTGGNTGMGLYVQVDGKGPWIQLGGMATSDINQNRLAYGEVAITGLTPGFHTFYMGWAASGNTVVCNAGSHAGNAKGTMQSVLTLPAGPYPSYTKSLVAANSAFSTSSASPAELDSSLRVTATVGASGKALISQGILAANNTMNAWSAIYVQVDGTGAWTEVGAYCTSYRGGTADTFGGEVMLTGLTPGSHTFYFGWATQAGTTTACNSNDPHFGGIVGATTFMSVIPVP